MDIGIKVALITAVAALIGHYVQQYFARRSDLQNKLRAKRVLVYTDLLQATQDALASGKHVFRDARLTARLITWATPEVIIAFTDVRYKFVSPKAELEAAVAKLIASIRKDLGHDDKEAGNLYGVLLARIYMTDAAAPQVVGPERGESPSQVDSPGQL